MRSHNFSVYAAIIFSSLGLISCANYPASSSATGSSGGTIAGNGGITTAPSTTSSGSSSSTSTTLTISSFSPASGTLSAAPTQVQVTFSDTPDQASASALANYTLSCGATSVNASSVTLSGALATVSFSAQPGIADGTSCSFTVSAAVKNSSGYFLSGARVASYTVSIPKDPNGDYTAPVGTISTPMPSDRVFGNVTVSSYAYDTGDNQSAVAYVEYYLDSTKLGSSSSSPNYSLSFNSAAYPNGTHTLSINVVDKAGNKATKVDSHSIVIANYSYTATTSAGGSGGTAFTDYAPYEKNLAGLQLQTDGTNIVQLVPVYESAWGADVVTQTGGTYGGSNASQTTLMCPLSGNYRVVGVFGYSGQFVEGLGLICSPQASPGSYWYDLSTMVGGNADNWFAFYCPVGKFVTRVMGRSGALLDQIQLGCQ